MSAPATATNDRRAASTSRHSARLKSLSDEAAEIRRLHSDGKLSTDEAAERIEALKRRYAGFLERLIDL